MSLYLSRAMAELWIQLKCLCQNPTAYNGKENCSAEKVEKIIKKKSLHI